MTVGKRLVAVPRLRIEGTLHRAVYAQYLDPARGNPPEPLYYKGSLAGRRFTPRKGPAGLYLSFDPATPMAELRAVIFEHGQPMPTSENEPIVVVAVRSVVHRVLDLTDTEVRKRVGLKRSELFGDWEREQDEYLAGRGRMPATQILALAAHLTGEFAGIRYRSARTDFGTNLVVFPDRLQKGRDLLEVIDATGRYRQRLP